VHTGSIVEGFAALLAYDPAADAATNVAAMTESAARVVPAEITQAVRDTTTEAGDVHVGDWIGVSRDGVISIADSPVQATCQLLTRLLEPHHELITMIEGEAAKAGDTRRISEWLSESFPDVALEVHHGGQPLYPYLLGLE
jgi:dihydroxyacetone kinase-like predicted kinase